MNRHPKEIWSYAICCLFIVLLSACEDLPLWIHTDNPYKEGKSKIALDLQTMKVYDRINKMGPICSKQKNCGLRHTNERSLCHESGQVQTHLEMACIKRFGDRNAYCEGVSAAISSCRKPAE